MGFSYQSVYRSFVNFLVTLWIKFKRSLTLRSFLNVTFVVNTLGFFVISSLEILFVLIYASGELILNLLSTSNIEKDESNVNRFIASEFYANESFTSSYTPKALLLLVEPLELFFNSNNFYLNFNLLPFVLIIQLVICAFSFLTFKFISIINTIKWTDQFNDSIACLTFIQNITFYAICYQFVQFILFIYSVYYIKSTTVFWILSYFNSAFESNVIFYQLICFILYIWFLRIKFKNQDLKKLEKTRNYKNLMMV